MAVSPLQKIGKKSGAKKGKTMVALYNEDPKTVDMRKDLHVIFGGERALWKKELLRAHDSQQQRNLQSRNLGFDERIVLLNRNSYKSIPAYAQVQERHDAYAYAESFEIEIFR